MRSRSIKILEKYSASIILSNINHHPIPFPWTISIRYMDIRILLEDYKKNKADQLYQAVMEIIVKANKNRLKEGKRDMCNALLELMKDELDEKREEGIKEGIKEGESLGENRINQLILKLSELNRTDEILKAAADREYQKKLLKEFGL